MVLHNLVLICLDHDCYLHGYACIIFAFRMTNFVKDKDVMLKGYYHVEVAAPAKNNLKVILDGISPP